MLLRGTERLSREQLDTALDGMGASLGVETRMEALILRGAVLSANLPRFLDLLTEVISRPGFRAPEIEKLKAEICAGIMEELGHDAELGLRLFNGFLFQGHPYGNPVVGELRSVRMFTEQDTRSQFDRLFRERGLLVLGSGDASPDAIRVWAKIAGHDPARGRAVCCRADTADKIR